MSSLRRVYYGDWGGVHGRSGRVASARVGAVVEKALVAWGAAVRRAARRAMLFLSIEVDMVYTLCGGKGVSSSFEVKCAALGTFEGA